MSEVPVWSCEFFPLTSPEAAALDALTVGSKFGLKCHGDLAVSWDAQPPHLTFAKPEENYTLGILKVVRQDPNDVQFEVTGYKPGTFTPAFVRVLQGQGESEKGFEAGKLNWKVQSVLDPKGQPQAVPPFGPFGLGLPLWFSLLAGALLLLFIYFVVRVIRRYRQRRRMLEELKTHKTALPPLHQFYRDARNLRRRMHNVKDPAELKAISQDLDREFRLYVLRQFQIPALVWSDREILNELHRRHRKTYRAAAEPLKRTLRELTKLKTRAQIGLEDVEQLHRMSLDAAERLETGGAR